MDHIIKLLPSSSFITVLESMSEGSMGFTYLALLRWIDGSDGRFFIKIYPPNTPKGLINEITGYLLANASHLPQPQKVGLLQISKPILDSLDIKNSLKSDGYVWAWATEDYGKTPKTYLKMELLSLEFFRNMLIHWEKINDLVSFDDWVANQDRNLGNMTIQPNETFAIIDHGFVPINGKWIAYDLDIDSFYKNKLLTFLWNDAPPRNTGLDIFDSAKEHNLFFENAFVELHYWWGNFLADEELNCLKCFLNERAQKSPDRIKNRLGILMAI